MKGKNKNEKNEKIPEGESLEINTWDEYPQSDKSGTRNQRDPPRRQIIQFSKRTRVKGQGKQKNPRVVALGN
jgi:hypothetical protein